jgi:hypothetical protein
LSQLRAISPRRFRDKHKITGKNFQVGAKNTKINGNVAHEFCFHIIAHSKEEKDFKMVKIRKPYLKEFEKFNYQIVNDNLKF